MGARRRNLRLARGSAESVCLRADRYLHHVEEHWEGTPSLRARRQNLWLARGRADFVCLRVIAACTMASQHLTPSLPPHPRPPPAPHGNLCFGYTMINSLSRACRCLGCTPLFPSPKSVPWWGVHRHRTGWLLSKKQQMEQTTEREQSKKEEKTNVAQEQHTSGTCTQEVENRDHLAGRTKSR